MRVLLVYPEYPETFWNFKHALRFIAKKAAYPPLGLLTVAAMLPADWEVRLIDMNVSLLTDDDLRAADYVMISAMSIQQRSVHEVIARCQRLGVRTIAGGPLFTENPADFDDVDHLVLNEAEVTLPFFLRDLGQWQPQHCYSSEEKADLSATPIPRWELINVKQYASLSLQVSRGCPFDCDFCNITALFGRLPRTKSAGQVVAELDRLYALGWRAGVFFVDDNLIGDRKKVKREILPAIIDWMRTHKYPFTLLSQVSIDLADDDALIALLVQAGFNTVFIGIESPNEASLAECHKAQNTHRDLLGCVRKLQHHGLQVQGGFIVGFDNDPASIFDRLIAFIQESGIVTAMVGLLNAPHGTRLYHRLQSEGRLLNEMSGDNTDFSLNFIPKMSPDLLKQGYQRIVESIYSPNVYYHRMKQFLREFHPKSRAWDMKLNLLLAGVKMFVILGMLEKERSYYWRLIFWSLFTRPRMLPMALTLAAYGFHFRKCVQQHVGNELYKS